MNLFHLIPFESFLYYTIISGMILAYSNYYLSLNLRYFLTFFCYETYYHPKTYQYFNYVSHLMLPYFAWFLFLSFQFVIKDHVTKMGFNLISFFKSFINALPKSSTEFSHCCHSNCFYLLLLCIKIRNLYLHCYSQFHFSFFPPIFY